MKKILLWMLALTLVTGVGATPANKTLQVRPVRAHNLKGAKVIESKKLANGLTVNVRETEGGFRFKQTARPLMNSSRVAPVKHASTAHKAKGNPTWSESFEGWDRTDYTWLPQEWTRHTNNEDFLISHHTWFPNTQVNAYVPAVPDGDVYMEILYNQRLQQNEWIDTPELTPAEGDKLNFTFVASPFYLFDVSKYDQSKDVLTERVMAWNFRVYVQPEGGSWKEVYNFFDEYKDVSDEEIFNLYMYDSYYGPMTIIQHIDMSEYVGQKIKVRFRYYGLDGNSMFLDDIQLGKPYIDSYYREPLNGLYMGMTQDWYTPVSAMIFPSDVDLAWRNMSSIEAKNYEWTYQDADKNWLTSNDTNLVARYPHVPEQVGALSDANIYQMPTLIASAEGFDHSVYSGAVSQFKVGGKAWFKQDGKEIHTGAGNYDPNLGSTIMIYDDDEPIAGMKAGAESNFWGDFYEAYYGYSREDYSFRVAGIYNAFAAPAKPYKLRGAWVQGIGDIDPKLADITLTIHTLTEEGEINETPLATAQLNTDEIQSYGDAADMGLSKCQRLTLPFVFSDPVDISELMFVRINGLDGAGVNYFAPLQNYRPATSCYGYVRIEGTIRSTGDKGTSLMPLYYINTDMGSNYASFYTTLDLAYDDAEDWGHVDDIQKDEHGIDIHAPELTLKPGHMQYHERGENIYDRTAKSAFYDTESDENNTTLYICAGQLFPGEEMELTNHIRIQIPNTELKLAYFGKVIDLADTKTVVAFYDTRTETYSFVGRQGQLKMGRNANGYDVELYAYDPDAKTSFGCIYTQATAQNWNDLNVKPTRPNQWSINNDGQEEIHALTGVTINKENPEEYVITLSSENETPIVICVPERLMDGKIHGFSAVASDALRIMFRDEQYSYSTTTVPNLGNTEEGTQGIGLGGNFCATIQGDEIELEWNLYSAKSADGHNVNGYYQGTYTTVTAIQGVALQNQSTTWDLSGRRVQKPTRGVYIRNGKLIIKN